MIKAIELNDENFLQALKDFKNIKIDRNNNKFYHSDNKCKLPRMENEQKSYLEFLHKNTKFNKLR